MTRKFSLIAASFVVATALFGARMLTSPPCRKPPPTLASTWARSRSMRRRTCRPSTTRISGIPGCSTRSAVERRRFSKRELTISVGSALGDSERGLRRCVPEGAPTCLRDSSAGTDLEGASMLMRTAYRWARPKLVRPPGFILPCQPVLATKVPTGDGWLHELKHDGFRIIAHKDGESGAPVVAKWP